MPYNYSRLYSLVKQILRTEVSFLSCCIKSKAYFILDAACGASVMWEFVHLFTMVISPLPPPACWLLRLLALLWSPGAVVAHRSPPALQLHLQKNHHHLYPLSPGSSLWSKSDQTPLMHHKPSSLLQFAPRAWWRLEGTERCFFFFSPLIWTTFCCLQKWAQRFFSELFLCPLT